jgi:mannose-6-phosphate isomerase
MTTINAATAATYKVGDTDQRPWGSYVVTGVGTTATGEEFCTKDITVTPGHILSLQSHEFRREHWVVKSGTLTVILNDKRLTLQPGESVDIPRQAIHCMANLTAAPCIVSELQEGICREADISRYVDANGRETEPLTCPIAEASVAHYTRVTNEIASLFGGKK